MNALFTAARRFYLRRKELSERPVDGVQPFKLSIRQRIVLTMLILIAVQILTLEARGVYYVFLETGIPLGWLLPITTWFRPFHRWLKGIGYLTNTSLWHAAVPDPFVRHGIRKTLEAIFAGVGGLVLSLNVLSAKHLRKEAGRPSLFSRLEMVLRIPNTKGNARRRAKGLPDLSVGQAAGALLFWQWIYGLAAVVPLLLLCSRLAHKLTTYSIAGFGPTWVQFLTELLTGAVAYTVIGLIGSPIAKRPVGPVLAAIENRRARAWVAEGKPIRWYHHLYLKPQFLELVRRIAEHGGGVAQAKLSRRSKWIGVGIAATNLVFLGFGVWQRFYTGT